MKKIIICLSLSISCIAANGQDIFLKDTVVVQGLPLQYLGGQHIEKLDSVTLGLFTGYNMAETLGKVSHLNIRRYGINGLSTVSFRGMGSNHTSLFWNGISLAPPSNGSIDVSQINLNGQDNISLQYGGNGSAFGSGTVGGAIIMDTNAPKKEGFSGTINQHIAQFGRLESNLSLHWKKNKYSTKTTFFKGKATNNFEYKNSIGTIKEQKHAASKKIGFTHHSFYELNKTSKIIARAWVQEHEIEIPAIASSAVPSQATQNDKSLRLLGGFNKNFERWSLQVNTAYLNDILLYKNPLSAGNNISKSNTHQSVNQIKLNYFRSPVSSFNFSGQYKHEWAVVDGYGPETQFRDNFSANLAYKYESDFQFTLQAGQEIINQQVSPFLFGANFSSNARKKVVGKFSFNRTFRVPTFNDLFWSGAGASGNSELLYEQGISTDLGLLTKVLRNDGGWKLDFDNTFFLNQTKNLIVWVNKSQEGIWTPENKNNVQSFGLESALKLHFKNSQTRFKSDLLYTYTNTEILESNDSREIGKPLPHTPSHLIRWVNFIQFKAHYFQYIHEFTGQQENSFDSFDVLDPFYTGDLAIGTSVKFQKIKADINLKANNVWDVDYQIRKGYPMPGRNYSLNLIFNL